MLLDYLNGYAPQLYFLPFNLLELQVHRVAGQRRFLGSKTGPKKITSCKLTGDNVEEPSQSDCYTMTSFSLSGTVETIDLDYLIVLISQWSV